MIGDAVKALAKSLQSVAGTSDAIRVRRGSEIIEPGGWPGQSNFDTVGDSGEIVEQFQSRDFFFLAADYAFGGVVTLPDRGDVVLETLDGVPRYYEVMAPLDGGQPYRFADTSRTLLRVHTKQVSDE